MVGALDKKPPIATMAKTKTVTYTRKIRAQTAATETPKLRTATRAAKDMA